MRPETRALLDEIDALLYNRRNENGERKYPSIAVAEVVSILRMLRGPDNENGDAKWETTDVLRRVALPSSGDLFGDLNYNRDTVKFSTMDRLVEKRLHDYQTVDRFSISAVVLNHWGNGMHRALAAAQILVSDKEEENKETNQEEIPSSD